MIKMGIVVGRGLIIQVSFSPSVNACLGITDIQSGAICEKLLRSTSMCGIFAHQMDKHRLKWDKHTFPVKEAKFFKKYLTFACS